MQKTFKCKKCGRREKVSKMKILKQLLKFFGWYKRGTVSPEDSPSPERPL